MTNNIHYLNCTANTIKLTLEHLEELVEKDDVVSMAVVAVCKDGGVQTAYIAEEELFALLGGVEYLKHRLLNYIEED